MTILPQFSDNINLLENAFQCFLKTHCSAALLGRCGIEKAMGVSARELIEYTASLAFSHTNYYRETQLGRVSFGKAVVYRFLNKDKSNWQRLLSSVAGSAVKELVPLTGGDRINALIFDDTLHNRDRSKKVEGLSRVYDHTTGKYYKGFKCLSAAWTDGNTTF